MQFKKCLNNNDYNQERRNLVKFNNTGSNRYPLHLNMMNGQEQVQVRTYNEDTNEYEDITTFEFDGPTTLVFTGVVPDSI